MVAPYWMSACAYSPACSACCNADTRPPTNTARAPTIAYDHDLLLISSPPSFSVTVGDALQGVPRRNGLTRDALKGVPHSLVVRLKPDTTLKRIACAELHLERIGNRRNGADASQVARRLVVRRRRKLVAADDVSEVGPVR